MYAKKLLALLLALVLCVSVLAGCSSVPKETTQATTQATEGTTAATAEATTQATTEAAPLTNAERYPIDFDGTLTCVTGRTNPDETAYWVMWEDITGVDVKWVTTAQEQTPLLFLDKKQMPDMFFQAHGLTVTQVNEYGQGGLLINIMDYLDQMPNLKARYEEDPMLFAAVKDSSGAVYALPYYCSTLSMAANLFYVRLDHTAAAGWEKLPATVEDFLLMCEDLKTYYADVEGYVPVAVNGPKQITYAGNVAQFFFPAFGELMQPGIGTNADATKIEIGFASEQYKHYMEFMHTLYAEGYLDVDCFINESATTKAMTNEGKVTLHNNATQLTTDNFASGELDFQVIPPMSSQYQSEARWSLPNNYQVSYTMISTTCSDIEAALAFMDACYSEENDPLNEEGTIWGAFLTQGEKGVHWTANEENGTFEQIAPEGYASVSDWTKVASSGSSLYKKWHYAESSVTGFMKKEIGTRDILMPAGVKVFYTSHLTLNQEEQEIYNDCWTDIENKVTEMNAAFITGQADIEAEWDNYIKALYDMGLQEVIDVYQAALDRYNGK